MSEQISIHPGVVGGRRVHPKVNTCKPRGAGKAKRLDRKQRRLNQRQLDHAATIKNLPPGMNPAAYRMPGSMNERK